MGCDCVELRREVEALRARVDSLLVNVEGPRDAAGRVTQPGLLGRVRLIEKRFDTGDSSRWKRVLFRVDGWGPWWQLRAQPRWRPWRTWGTS
jgi:hypothetical protein